MSLCVKDKTRISGNSVSCAGCVIKKFNQPSSNMISLDDEGNELNCYSFFVNNLRK